MLGILLSVLLLVDPTEPPGAYCDASGAIVGTDVDLGRAIAAELGEPLEIEASSFSRMLPRLRAGTADLAIAVISITEARKRDVDFSIPYGHEGCAFLYPTNGPRPRMSHIEDFRIGVSKDSVGDMYLSGHHADPVRYTNLDTALSGLKYGDIDAIFFDQGPLREMARTLGEGYRVSSLVTRENYGVAVSKKRPDVLAAANRVIAARKEKVE